MFRLGLWRLLRCLLGGLFWSRFRRGGGLFLPFQFLLSGLPAHDASPLAILSKTSSMVPELLIS